MRIAGAYNLHGPREQVWPLIQDPAALVRLIPGCDRLEETVPREYRGQMQIPVAAVAGVYETHVRLREDIEPYTTRFDGEMSGPAGAIRGSAWFRLDQGDDAATSVLTYEGQGIITGPLSRMDGRIADSIARSLLSQGLANLDRQLQEKPSGVILTPVSARRPAAITPTQDRLRSLIQLAVHFFERIARRVRAMFQSSR